MLKEGGGGGGEEEERPQRGKQNGIQDANCCPRGNGSKGKWEGGGGDERGEEGSQQTQITDKSVGQWREETTYRSGWVDREQGTGNRPIHPPKGARGGVSTTTTTTNNHTRTHNRGKWRGKNVRVCARVCVYERESERQVTSGCGKRVDGKKLTFKSTPIREKQIQGLLIGAPPSKSLLAALAHVAHGWADRHLGMPIPLHHSMWRSRRVLHLLRNLSRLWWNSLGL